MKDCLYFRPMIFVTGGTGLLGSHLLFQLTECKTPIKAIYRDETKINTVFKIFQFYDPLHFQSKFDLITWVKCDILDVISLEEEMKNCDFVYHCAALVSFCRRDFYKMMKINREGTSNVINAALKNNITKLGYISSTAAIGSEDEIVTENTKWKQSPETSGYSISKYSAEKEVWRGVEEGLDVIILNPCLIVGAGNWNESSMTIFRTIANGLKFYTPGSNAFVDARDVAETLVKLMQSNLKNERFLCIGENSSFKDLFDEISKQLNRKPPSIKVSKFLINFAWILAGILARIRRKKPTITRETARSSFSNTVYNASKIRNALDFKFKTKSEMIENAIKGRLD
ncbi:MAG: NAD-dependent epimerase/dehydratase family protein [Flavobacteriia bacterium]|nr:NAD-dependent epimerase/dehydratase family protein [Flavobacteriia bacterium]